LLPTILTLSILWWVLSFFYRLGAKINALVLLRVVNRIMFHGQHMGEMIAKQPRMMVLMNVIGVLMGFVAIFALGLFLLSFLGRKVWSKLDGYLARLPIVRMVYPHAKKVTDFFFTEKALEFRSVCAIPYPRKGLWSLGFVTGAGLKSIANVTQKRMLAVFIPSSPTPVTGYVVYVPAEDIISLPLSVEQMLTITMSGGVVAPASEFSELVNTASAALDGSAKDQD